ncbi:MAG: hypothetical protein JW795_13260 [Chitinivibrionales bacterium]|nr:hypothetical protein [Chitinivibrionales bacterium]
MQPKVAILFSMVLATTVYSAQYKWMRISPADVDSVLTITIAPSNENIMYFSVFQDAVWRSDDRGMNWTRLKEFGGCKGVNSLAIHPEDPYTLYVTNGG